ncbi:IclR family transcriptional regulator domain-containing protein [Natrinema versiforme]|uniref:ArcR family transcription regulator n=1 Tax=Natrinema versiforme JCM 10478 TaxID=1227496 RepID=L9XNI9_9EURY|nr:ArcR family transcription regulator [Natrinema versiforme JCM 10478]
MNQLFSVTDGKTPFAELAQIRERGYASDATEKIDGFRATSASTRDTNDRVLVSLSVCDLTTIDFERGLLNESAARCTSVRSLLV